MINQACTESKLNIERQKIAAAQSLSTEVPYVVNRALMLEIHLRLALSLFHTQTTKEQAFFLYIETKLRPYHARMQIDR